MDDFTKFDPHNNEFFKSVFLKKLRATAKSLFEGKTYGDYSEEDLLNDTLEMFYKEEPWKRKDLQDHKNLGRYMARVMQHIHLKWLAKSRRTDSVEVVAEEKLGTNKIREQIQDLVERKSIARALKSYFPRDLVMHRLIDLEFVDNMTRAEIAEVMKLSPRKVTDLKRRLIYVVPEPVILRLVGRVPRQG